VCMHAPASSCQQEGRQAGRQAGRRSGRQAGGQAGGRILPPSKHLLALHRFLRTLMLTGLPLMSGWAALPSGPRNHHWRPDLSFTGQVSTTSALSQGLTDR
jgi:hypothetical protein